MDNKKPNPWLTSRAIVGRFEFEASATNSEYTDPEVEYSVSAYSDDDELHEGELTNHVVVSREDFLAMLTTARAKP